MLQKEWRDNFSIVDNIKYIMAMLKGAYAVAIISQKFSDKIVAVRSGSPLVIGVGIDENFISSDALSLLPVTNKFSYLDEGDIAIISKDNVEVFDNNGAAKILRLRSIITLHQAPLKMVISIICSKKYMSSQRQFQILS